MGDIVKKIKEKKEFSGLPDSLIEKVLNQKGIKSKSEEEKIKLSREFLRKYFGVFLTNKVLKGNSEDVLKKHISSKNRDYDLFYNKISDIVDKKISSVIDVGCGINGFSFNFIKKYFGDIKYIGIESAKQLCDSQNEYFKKNNLDAKIIHCDATDILAVKEIIKKTKSPKAIFMFQVMDAFENIRPNFFKEFISDAKHYLTKDDYIIISFSTKTLSGGNKKFGKVEWTKKILLNDFKIIERFDMFYEDIIIAKLYK